MPRTTITEVSQIGVETTSGTSVAANKRLQSMMFSLSPTIEVSTFRPQGFKFATVTAMNKKWAQGSISGTPTYDEIIYPLSSVIGTATTTSLESGAATSWFFAPSTTALDAPKTYTIESGSASRAHKVTYGIFTGFNINYNNGRESIEIGGDMMGQAFTDGITLTASPTSLPLFPVLPSQTSFYYDSTSAGLGTTKLLSVRGASFSISGRYGPNWVYDSALTSWKEHVETEPTVEVTIMVEANTQGMSLYTDAENGTSKFLRMASLGTLIAGTTSREFILDVCVKWTGVSEFSDEDGLYAIEFTGQAHHDATWTRALQATVKNATSAL